MSILIGLAGQPSSGKSTLAARLFARLKDLGVSCELATEYCKGWVWDKREITPFSQYYFFGKQSYVESHLFHKVDFIISDSPTFLSAFYNCYNNNDTSLNVACKKFYEKAEENGVTILNFLLPRKKKYNPKGRWQSEEQADEVARRLKDWLNEEEYSYTELTCSDADRIEVIMDELKRATNNFEGMLND